MSNAGVYDPETKYAQVSYEFEYALVIAAVSLVVDTIIDFFLVLGILDYCSLRMTASLLCSI